MHIIEESTGSGVYNTVDYSDRPLNNRSFDYSPARQKLKATGPIPLGNNSINVNQIQTISAIDRVARLVKMRGWPGGIIISCKYVFKFTFWIILPWCV